MFLNAWNKRGRNDNLWNSSLQFEVDFFQDWNSWENVVFFLIGENSRDKVLEFFSQCIFLSQAIMFRIFLRPEIPGGKKLWFLFIILKKFIEKSRTLCISN